MTQLRGDSHQNSDDYSGNQKKEAYSGGILVIELTAFAERFDDYRSINDSFQVSGLRTWVMKASYSAMGKTYGQDSFGEKINNSIQTH